VRYSTVVFSPANPYRLESLANYTWNFDLFGSKNDGTAGETDGTVSELFTTGDSMLIRSILAADLGYFLSCSYLLTRS